MRNTHGRLARLFTLVILLRFSSVNEAFVWILAAETKWTNSRLFDDRRERPPSEGKRFFYFAIKCSGSGHLSNMNNITTWLNSSGVASGFHLIFSAVLFSFFFPLSFSSVFVHWGLSQWQGNVLSGDSCLWWRVLTPLSWAHSSLLMQPTVCKRLAEQQMIPPVCVRKALPNMPF